MGSQSNRVAREREESRGRRAPVETEAERAEGEIGTGSGEMAALADLGVLSDRRLQYPCSEKHRQTLVMRAQRLFGNAATTRTLSALARDASEPPPGFVQRQAEEEEEEPVQAKPKAGLLVQRQGTPEEEEPVQTKANGTRSHSSVSGVVRDVLQSGAGRPLEEGVRALMESRFGHDFGDVRVHTGSKAAESAEAINARAYTAGRDIVFGAGQYAPTTAEGQRLLAHELVHTVQQSSGEMTLAEGRVISDPSDSYEREADRVAEQVSQRNAVEVGGVVAGANRALTGGGSGLAGAVVARQHASPEAPPATTPDAAPGPTSVPPEMVGLNQAQKNVLQALVMTPTLEALPRLTKRPPDIKGALQVGPAPNAVDDFIGAVNPSPVVAGELRVASSLLSASRPKNGGHRRRGR
ncbi:MAG: eCIS core domain-containing protein [Chloroflexota bacterium]